MTHDELMALPDVTPTFMQTEIVINGKRLNVPVQTGVIGALWQQPEDGTFTDRTGMRWMVGRYQGERVRRMVDSHNYRAQDQTVVDDPEADETDYAHPAWWRGHAQSCAVFCQKVNEILDGKDNGHGISNDPWESTRRRLLQLVKEAPPK